MTVLLQISDPHFGTARAHVADALRHLVQHQQPDLLVLSGDITQRATRAQFTAAHEYLQTLDVPRVLAIPGNHDIPLFNLAARLFYPYARYCRVFGNALESEFESDDLLLLMLNTTRRYRHIDGELSDEQIARVTERLKRARPECWRIVVTHQPLAVPEPRYAHDLLHGHKKALHRWAAAGADVLMGGHIHLPYVLPVHRQQPELAAPLWVVQAGTALSHRVRVGVPNSVNLLRVNATERRQLGVERWDYHDAAQRFECVKVDHLTPPRLRGSN